MHGKTSPIHHTGQGVFAGLENPFLATRYHSLVIDRATCPEVLDITAWVEDGTIMGVQHREYPHLQGCSFTPRAFSPSRAYKFCGTFGVAASDRRSIVVA
jgi:anthranilate synthase component 2